MGESLSVAKVSLTVPSAACGSHPTTPQIKALDQSPWSSSPEDPDTPFNQAIRSLPADVIDSLHAPQRFVSST
jgi:hypothetical protein